MAPILDQEKHVCLLDIDQNQGSLRPGIGWAHKGFVKLAAGGYSSPLVPYGVKGENKDTSSDFALPRVCVMGRVPHTGTERADGSFGTQLT